MSHGQCLDFILKRFDGGKNTYKKKKENKIKEVILLNVRRSQINNN